MGPTSGAAFMVARWWAKANPGALTVVMLPDEGYRYQDTVYDDEWLAAAGHLGAELPAEPTPTDHPGGPASPGGAWTALEWGRRSLTEVLAASGDPASMR
jgi:cysteine synthase A